MQTIILILTNKNNQALKNHEMVPSSLLFQKTVALLYYSQEGIYLKNKGKNKRDMTYICIIKWPMSNEFQIRTF